MYARTFPVRIGNAHSNVHVYEKGVPQGGVLSCTLFRGKMNSLRKALPPTISSSGYVDDDQISFDSCNMSICERQAQLGANKLAGWADTNGFKLNAVNGTCVVFTRVRGVYVDPLIALNGLWIPVKKEHKFLGLIFDNKLKFLPHLQMLKQKCLKYMNILTVVSHQPYGADKQLLLRLYTALVGSHLDYGSVMYGSATKMALKMLDPNLHLGLRLACGTFRPSPVESVYAECHKLSLYHQTIYTDLLYASRIMSMTNHPFYLTIQCTLAGALFKPSIYSHAVPSQSESRGL